MTETNNRINTIREGREDRIFNVINVILVTLLLLMFAYPLYFVIIASISDPNAIWRGEVLLLPRDVSMTGYIEVLKHGPIWRGFANSVGYTGLGLVVNMLMTTLTAYVLSRREFMIGGIMMKFMVFTMYFGGGLIPNYLLVKSLHIYNTAWALVLPGAISTFNLIIMRTFFMNSIPNELREAALLDGCGDMRYLLLIVLPLSKAVLAVIALYYGLSHWNSYFSAMIYLENRNMYPLQLVLRDIIMRASAIFEAVGDESSIAEQLRLAEVVKYCAIIVASIPPLIVYPLVQKSFVKGVMIGSVKG